MEKRYGLPTAICMVVGIVIGSGVFFKAEKVLQATKGNMPLGILAWGIVGAIMIICSYVFATMATRYEKVSGLVDYAEATVGRRYAYYVGWFMAVLYTPCLVSALAWISARYFCVLLGWDITGGACMTIAGAMLCLDHVLNALAPRLAGRFQVSTTVIKMIPLALMAACGAAAPSRSCHKHLGRQPPELPLLKYKISSPSSDFSESTSRAICCKLSKSGRDFSSPI